MRNDEPRVVLLSMPWAALGEPSLGLGILKACLLRAGIPVRVRHCNLFLLRYLRASTYVGLANAYALNDFMFTYDLDPEVSAVQYRLARQRVSELREIGVLNLGTDDADEAMEKLIEARRTIFPQWLDECADFVVAERPTLVGLTCLFDQTMSSVALARKIRMRLPSATIVLGGYALEGPAAREILRCFPWVDAVCMGEGESAIVELAHASAGSRPLEGVANLVMRSSSAITESPVTRYRRGRLLALQEPIVNRAPPITMDESPVPNFDDYFTDLDELKQVDQVEIEIDTLPVESSRGCWWGQQKHCVFCGIDDETMRYRARSAENTIQMLDTLNRQYGISSFRFSDYILPHAYFNTLLPKLAGRAERYHLECELKSNLTEEKFQLLKAAGFGEFQPGIESFSSSVLAKMDKGVTGIRNIQTLVLGKIYGIRIHWNFLFGFPDDELVDYEAMLSVIPLLYHLDPPHGCQEVEITRFAPLQVDPERFGIKPGAHALLYDIIFSPDYLTETGFNLDAYAYYFERTFWNSPAIQRAHNLLVTQTAHWKQLKAARAVTLTWLADSRNITFHDSRYSEVPEVSTFGSLHKAVFQACAGRACSIDTISKSAGIKATDAENILAELIDARVVMREAGQYIGLAVPAGQPTSENGFRRKWVMA